MVEIFENIRKIYTFSHPCEELAGHVEFFSESCPHATRQYLGGNAFTVKMFPAYTPTFWLNLGPAYRLAAGNCQHLVNAGEDVLVIRDGTTERINHANDHIFTVKFFPGGLQAIFGIAQPAIKNIVTPLADILPGHLLQKLKSAADFSQRMQLMQNYMLAQLAANSQPDYYTHIVKQSIAYFQEGSLQFNVGQLAERLFVSSKSINRYFTRAVGVTPKHYFSVLRARAALSAYVEDTAAFNPAAYGYHDASHYYKEAARFTGQKLVDARR